MRTFLSFVILLLCACNRFADQQIELSDAENNMVAPPCKCRIGAQNLAIKDDAIYNKDNRF